MDEKMMGDLECETEKVGYGNGNGNGKEHNEKKTIEKKENK
jgi:hypothetical protein